MGIKRIVDTNFWNDDKVMDMFSPEDKLFMLYLLTNPHTTQLGVYYINKKNIAFEMGYSLETINVLMERFENKYSIIKYSEKTKELAIKNYLKYSIIKGGKPVEDCLIKEIKQIKDKDLLKYIYNSLIDYRNINETVKKILPLLFNENEKQNEKQNEKENDNDNDNDNEVSYHDTYDDTCNDTSNKIIDNSNIDYRLGQNETIDENIDIEEDFEKFYKAYPRKVGKANVEKWFIKNKPSKDLLETMLDKLELYKKTKQWQDKQFIPHPTTWLNQKRWEDEIEVEKDTPKNNLSDVAIEEEKMKNEIMMRIARTMYTDEEMGLK